MKKSYCFICGKSQKFEKHKILHIFEKHEFFVLFAVNVKMKRKNM